MLNHFGVHHPCQLAYQVYGDYKIIDTVFISQRPLFALITQVILCEHMLLRHNQVAARQSNSLHYAIIVALSLAVIISVNVTRSGADSLRLSSETVTTAPAGE